ncbi:MAG: leucine-rich repeat domain-containing protein, partial [Muribaculaceae bacterium]|nr:leucine-rich repeat domain-containing protein [Muribaculaceae bacterium]
DNDKIANFIPSNLLYNPSAANQVMPVVEEIILPNSVTRIADAAFQNCEKLKEITLPLSLGTDRIQVGTYASSGKPKYVWPLGSQVFKGCSSLTTIYIPGQPSTVSIDNQPPRMVVSHFNPAATTNNVYMDAGMASYDLGFRNSDNQIDGSKITVVVPQEYLSVYQTTFNNADYGNIWKKHGYNILSQNPVYSVNFDPTRVKATEGTDVSAIASFLGDNVALESISTEGKLMLANPQTKCKIFDNGVEIQANADGSIPVTFYNPAKNAEKAGHHNIEVFYTHDVKFSSASSNFAISAPEVSTEGSSFDTADALNPVLRDVAENSEVRFKVDFATAHAEGLEARVMSGNEELFADEDGYYTLSIVNAGKNIDIFAVPTDGATINSEDLASIKPEEAHAVTSISLEGNMTSEDLDQVKECFPNLETLDLSTLEGELPEGAFKNMESLTTVVLPEVSEIGANMFSGCGSLQSVDIPATVGAIGSGAFEGCSSLEKITLTGVSSIGDGAFEGCDNLTTITLLASSADPKSDVRRKSQRKASALSSKAFSGVNPNCMIVLDEGVEVPSATANYILTKSENITETEPDGSVITRQGRVYSANSDINFIQGYPLSIPHAFTLTDGAVISLEVETNDWTATVVPFDVEAISDAANNEMAVALAEEGAEVAEGNLIYTLPEGGEALQSVDKMKANVPYIIRTVNNGKTLFTAGDITVPSTPAEISVAGKDYTIHATYSARTLPTEGTYILDSDASAFRPAESQVEEGEEEVHVAPFTLYATSPAGLGDIVTDLPGVEYIPTVVDEAEMAVKAFKVVKEGNAIVIYSPEKSIETVYKADGSVVRTVRVNAGRNVVELPAAGVYIIRDTKVVF